MKPLTVVEAQVLAGVVAGRQRRDIAEEMNLSTVSIWHILKRVRDKGHEVPEAVRAAPTQDRIAALVDKGLDNHQIAERLGLTMETIRSTRSKLRRRGLIPAPIDASVSTPAAASGHHTEEKD